MLIAATTLLISLLVASARLKFTGMAGMWQAYLLILAVVKPKLSKWFRKRRAVSPFAPKPAMIRLQRLSLSS
jgi:hypothetical protein